MADGTQPMFLVKCLTHEKIARCNDLDVDLTVNTMEEINQRKEGGLLGRF